MIMEATPQRKTGVILTWKKDRNFGIIQVGGRESLEKYFLAEKFIRSGTAVPKVGMTVVFEVSPIPPRAVDFLPNAIRADVIVPKEAL
jgi:hypothetical protein